MDPQQLRYAETHEWVAMEGDIATIGISKFAVEQLTDLVYIELPAVGKTVAIGKEFGEVESVKAVSPLYSPVAGTVTEVNEGLKDSLEVLGSDPYGAGWMIRVKVSPSGVSQELMDWPTYEKQCGESH